MENPDFQKVVDRLLSACQFETEQELADALGFKRSAFTVRKTRNSLPRAEIDVLIHERGLRPEWVYEGQGAMFAGKGFAARVKQQAKFDAELEKFRLSEVQHRYLRGLLMAFWDGEERLLKDRLNASEALTAPERELVLALRDAPSAVAQALLVLAKHFKSGA